MIDAVKRVTVAKVMFNAYRNERHATAYDESKIPPWEELRDDIRDGWEAAAIAVIKMLER